MTARAPLRFRLWDGARMHPADYVHTLHNLDDDTGAHLLAVVSVEGTAEGARTTFDQVRFGVGDEVNRSGAERALMASTGLRDAAGREVFELDVVETPGDDRPCLTVRWDAETAQYVAASDDGRPVVEAWRAVRSGRVVGNVYEGGAGHGPNDPDETAGPRAA